MDNFTTPNKRPGMPPSVRDQRRALQFQMDELNEQGEQPLRLTPESCGYLLQRTKAALAGIMTEVATTTGRGP